MPSQHSTYQVFMEPAEDWVKEIRRWEMEIKLHGQLPGYLFQRW